MITLAVVDMGSNAIRIHISNLLETEIGHEFKTIEYMRIPLRLGEDVFKFGSISETKLNKLVRLGQSIMVLFELFEVNDYLCSATSAMREAINGNEVIQKVKEMSGFEIQVIDGETEAEWANLGLKKFVQDGIWVHVDVGGGSTEVNVYQDKVKLAGKSFRIGAVRLLLKEDVSEAKNQMKVWVNEQVSALSDGDEVIALGTGGNIAKLYEIAKIKTRQPIRLHQIEKQAAMIDSFSLQDRINKLKLNPDRADVIVPSADIYTSVMKAAGARLMYVPKVGLTDGLFEVLKAKYESSLNSRKS